MKRKRRQDNCSIKSTLVDSSAVSQFINPTDIMAPALLNINGKGESKKSKLSSKQNKKKMDPEESANSPEPLVPEELIESSVDYDELKATISTEDHFICNLLAHIPSHGVVAEDSEDEGVTGDEKEGIDTNVSTRASNPDELKERLAAKLSQFQGKKLDFSGKKMKMKLKKKLDKLEKKKLKRKNSKMRSKIAKLAQETKAAAVTTSTIKTEAIPEPTVPSRPPKPVFNSEGRMVFSKFDFGELTAPTSVLKKTTNDPKAALHKIKKVKEKLETLESKGLKDKAKAIQEKRAWDGAIQRAEGIKVKDNEEMLVKSIKRNEQKKKQSKKKWEERIQAQEKRQEDAQKKRKTNIKARKDKVKESKLSRMAKRGKIILK